MLFYKSKETKDMRYLNFDFSLLPETWHSPIVTAEKLFFTLLHGKTLIKKGTSVQFAKGKKGTLCVKNKNGRWFVSAGDLSMSLRGLAMVLSQLEISEKDEIASRGLMLDASRNRVWTVDFIKKTLLLLAFCGYDYFMLYTEDVYELPDEPAFGFMRGRYTAEEIMECKRFARSMGIKMIPCIQTLGHMKNLLKHSQYSHVKDTADILLADEDATYILIEKMLVFWKTTLESDEIHVGLDEAVLTGRGRYLEKHGLCDRKEILLKHLNRVAALCEKYSMTPVIWADLLLHEKDESLEQLKERLPGKVKLCHWDYSGNTVEKYLTAFHRLEGLNKEIIMTGSIYSYNVFTWVSPITEKVLPVCIEACRQFPVKRYLASVWGDAGAFCCSASWLAGISFASFLLRKHKVKKAHGYTAKFFRTLTGENYDFFLDISDLEMLVNSRPIPAPGLFWEDPVQASVYGYCFTAYPEKMEIYLKKLQKIVENGKKTGKKTTSEKLLLKTAETLFSLLSMRKILLDSYRKRDKKELEKLINDSIPHCKKLMKSFDNLFRKEWLNSGKEFGLEIIQRRNSGVVRRLEELRTQLKELLNGKRKNIAELDESLLVFDHPENIIIPPVFSGCSDIYWE